jgi:modulator of FtsH protease HflK
MAWNQPGGQNNNPWGRRPGQSGNLDEKVRDWQRRLESLLRPGGGARDGDGGGGGSLLPTIGMLLLLAVWIITGFYRVNAAERGVIQRFGKLVDVRQQGWGWRWPWPIETITKVNVAEVNSSEYKSRVLTRDVNLVDLRFGVQYRYNDPIKVLFQVRDPKDTVNQASESAIREIVGQNDLDSVLAGGRQKITDSTKELIQRILDFYNAGITVTTVNLTDVQVPEAVVPSQRDANKALADRDRFEKEAQAYANGILPVARGEAARMQQHAEAYKAQVTALAEGQASRFSQLSEAYAQAPEVTRQRLYLDTVENVLGRSRKVFIDSESGGSGGGNLFYLPLDRLLERGAIRDDASSETQARGAPLELESVTVDGRARGER